MRNGSEISYCVASKILFPTVLNMKFFLNRDGIAVERATDTLYYFCSSNYQTSYFGNIYSVLYTTATLPTGDSISNASLNLYLYVVSLPVTPRF